MHIVLTDVLTCPSCAESQGLVAQADHIEDRHIRQGALGCPICRRQYPIREGVAWLHSEDASGSGDPSSDPAADENGEEEAVRIAALLALDRVNGFVLLMGRACRHAARVSAFSEKAEIVTAARTGPVSPAFGTVSQLVVGGGLPFLPGKLRGIWLAGETADSHLEAATAALQPSARLVLDPAPADAEQRLPAGFRVVAEQDGTLVCERAG